MARTVYVVRYALGYVEVYGSAKRAAEALHDHAEVYPDQSVAETAKRLREGFSTRGYDNEGECEVSAQTVY